MRDDLPAALRTLPTLLRAGEGGGLGRISVADQDVADLAALKRESPIGAGDLQRAIQPYRALGRRLRDWREFLNRVERRARARRG